MISIKAADYFIHFEENGYTELNNLINSKSYSSIFILVDEHTLDYCYPKFIQNLETNSTIEVIEIESGEEHKNLDTCLGVWDAMTELNADRKSLLITLGGGVITDLGGFVASTFKRGIDFINIPTTLLSLVDASVGGKTGIDLGVLKNHIGLFSNPEMVLIDTSYLETLSEREIKSGIAEIIKYGLTYDVDLYHKIKDISATTIQDLIHRSIEIKNEVVLKDPKENYLRKILNFGHTLGHAIESFFLENSSKESLRHGEAIAIGMVCECYLSYKLFGFSMEETKQIKSLVIDIYGKVEILEKDIVGILDYLKYDKKNIKGQVNFVLLENLGQPKIDCKVDNALLLESINFYKNY